MKKYLPTLAQFSQEIIVTGAAMIVIAWLISKNPALKNLVKNYSTSTSTQ